LSEEEKRKLRARRFGTINADDDEAAEVSAKLARLEPVSTVDPVSQLHNAFEVKQDNYVYIRGDRNLWSCELTYLPGEVVRSEEAGSKMLAKRAAATEALKREAKKCTLRNLLREMQTRFVDAGHEAEALRHAYKLLMIVVKGYCNIYANLTGTPTSLSAESVAQIILMEMLGHSKPNARKAIGEGHKAEPWRKLFDDWTSIKTHKRETGRSKWAMVSQIHSELNAIRDGLTFETYRKVRALELTQQKEKVETDGFKRMVVKALLRVGVRLDPEDAVSSESDDETVASDEDL